ncbi:hypothetical protein WMF20_49555 [Sorangium sp. So ce834]|uniref:hypothetical protein n=1 Tax=Sorangium sp. So ce834 TaxID=3133321 RepID=UPI003F5F739B
MAPKPWKAFVESLIMHKEPMGPCPEGYEDICVASYFHKGLGRRVFAWQYGKRCFVLRVKQRTEGTPGA